MNIGIVCYTFKLGKFKEELDEAHIVYEIIKSTSVITTIKCISEQHIIQPIVDKVTQYFIDKNKNLFICYCNESLKGEASKEWYKFSTGDIIATEEKIISVLKGIDKGPIVKYLLKEGNILLYPSMIPIDAKTLKDVKFKKLYNIIDEIYNIMDD